MMKNKQKLTDHPYVMLLFLSLVTGILLYYQFIFGDKILAYAAWGSDTRQSYLPTYEFWYLRLMQGRLSVYDLSYGWGTNIFPVLWGIVDPFSALPILLGTIFGINFIGRSLVYFQIAKSCVISLLGLKYFETLGYSRKSAFIPSYILGYCGYMIVTGEHYFFSTYAVFFMLILLYTEKILQDRKFYLLMSIGIAGLTSLSAYAMFQTTLIIGLYVLLRSLMLSEDIREYMLHAARVVGTAIVGILLSMFSFIMQVYNIFVVSGRTESDDSFIDKLAGAFRILPRDSLKETIYNLFSSDLLGTVNQYSGSGDARFCTTPYFFSCIFSFALVYFVIKTIKTTQKKKESFIRYTVLVLGSGMMFSCFYVLITNLFVYLQWRYVFTVIPFFAWCIVDLLEDIRNEQKISFAVFVIPVLAAAGILFTCDMQISGAKTAVICMFAFTCIIAGILFCYNRLHKLQNPVITGSLLLVIIAANLLIDDGIVVYKDQRIMTKAELEDGFRDSRIQSMIDEIGQKEQDNFWRIDRTYVDGVTPDIMLSFVHPARTLSVYDSTINTNLINAVTTLADTSFYTQEGYNIDSCGMKFDPLLADLFGLKYIISEQVRTIPGWKLCTEDNGLYLYENTKLGSAGQLYDEFITEQEYESLNPVEQHFALQRYLIVGDKEAVKSEKTEISYTDVSKRIGKIKCSEEGDIFSLEKADMQKIESICLTGSISGEAEQTVTVVFSGDDQQKLNQKEFVLTQETENIVCSVPQDASSVKIQYDRQKVSVSDLKLYCSSEWNYRNSGINLKNYKMGYTIEGTVETETDSGLLIPVPYESCWKAKVNGESVECTKADYGFIMVRVPAGSNEVVIQYENNYYRFGIVISLGTLAGVIIFCLYRRRKKSVQTA